MKFSLKNKIVFPMIMLVCAVSIAIGAGVVISARSIMAVAFSDKMTDNCAAALSEMDGWLDAQRKLTACWAADPDAVSVLKGDASAADARFRAALLRIKATTGIERIFVCSPDGIVRASSQPDTVGKTNLSDRDYVKGALAGKETISDAIMSKVSMKPIVAIGQPLRENGKNVGVLACVLDLGSVSQDIIKPFKILESGYVFMFDKTEQILAHPDASLILEAKLNDFDWGRQIAGKDAGALEYDGEAGVQTLVFARSEQYGWGAVATVPVAELYAPVNRLVWIVLFIGLAAVSVGIVLSLLTAGSITKPLYRVVHKMNELAEHTTSASAEVAQASNTLADGASQQASAIEETSASVEEVSSMARQNAEGSGMAKELAAQARRAAEAGAGDMQEMGEAMHGMKDSSDRIRNIVKTIDEIAFQTNILALNAAVEAARAGEAGAGFAVVADEVRTLAQRSAKAAKETATMIDDSMHKTERGVGLNARVSQSLGEIVEKIRQVDELVAQAAQASNEQSQGISQVNTAISSMDQITQHNAASAEECAGASAELSTQAVRMREVVAELQAIAEGESAKGALQPQGTSHPQLRQSAGHRNLRLHS